MKKILKVMAAIIIVAIVITSVRIAMFYSTECTNLQYRLQEQKDRADQYSEFLHAVVTETGVVAERVYGIDGYYIRVYKDVED